MQSLWSSPTDSAPARAGIEDRLAQLIAIPTISAHRDELGAAPFEQLLDLLQAHYPLVHSRLERERIGELGVVYTWLPSEPSAAAPVVLMAHFDVVPVSGQEDQWSVPPFEGRVSDGVVWGRGALDDKGSLVVLLDAVENLLAEGWAPPREVLLCFGGDEETHGHAARLIADTLKQRGVRPSFVLDEGGAITPLPFPGLSGWFAMIGLAEKGVMAVRLSVTAAGGHASAPNGLTAVGRIARAVARLNHNPFRLRMPRTVRLLFQRLAEHAEQPYAGIYRAAATAPAVTSRLLPLLGAEGEAMVRTSLAPTMLSGGTSANVLPSQATATLNLRVNVGESCDQVVTRLRAVIDDPEVSIDIIEADEPTPEAAVDNAAWDRLRDAVTAAYPGVAAVPYLTTAATDGRHWHRFTPNVYRFSPLAMDAEQRASIHAADERVSVDALVRGERFYRALLLGL